MPDSREHKVSCSNYQCEIELTLEILSGKWKALIIWDLHLHGIIRIVSRTVHPTIPPTTEYQLTELGNELIPIMSAMDQWGKKYVRLYQEEQTQK